MALLTNFGVRYKSEMSLGIGTYTNLRLRLFTNPLTFLFTTETADLTECSLLGYSPVTLSPGSWSESEVGGLATFEYPTVTFVFDPYAGGTTIYGFFCTRGGDEATVFGETLGAPFVVPSAGGSMTVNLTWLDQSVPT